MSAKEKPRRRRTGGAATPRTTMQEDVTRGSDRKSPSLQRLLAEEVRRFGPTWLGRDGQERPRNYMVLVAQAAARMERATGEPAESFIGPGYEGLAAAARRFDRARGAPFSAFAQPWVRGAMLRSLHHGAREPAPQGDERWTTAQRTEAARRLYAITEPGGLVRHVVEYRLLANGERQTLEEIGRLWNVSREYVRKVEADLIERARAIPEPKAVEVAEIFATPTCLPGEPLANAAGREEVERLSAEVTAEERSLRTVATGRQCRWNARFCPHNPPCKGV